MLQSKRHIATVSLIAAISGFQSGFATTLISGRVTLVKKYFELIIIGGDFKLGWTALLRCRLPILLTLSSGTRVLRNLQQPLVIPDRLARPWR